jgi:hypothetical protein
VDYRIAPDEEDLRLVENGQLSFFDANHGGYVTVHRSVLETPAYHGGGIASDRFRPANVAGYAAVIGDPIFAEGFGLAAVVVWDPERQVLTVVEGSDIVVDDLVRIVEGILR